MIPPGGVESDRPSHRFTPEQRLRKRREFLRIQDRGRRIHGRRFIFSIQPGATDKARIGITVSRKVGNAVVRNRIKRWVREAFRQHPELFRYPIDVVMTAKRGIEDFSYAAVRDELIDVITRYYESPGEGRHRGGHGPSRARRGHRPRGSGADRAV